MENNSNCLGEDWYHGEPFGKEIEIYYSDPDTDNEDMDIDNECAHQNNIEQTGFPEIDEQVLAEMIQYLEQRASGENSPPTHTLPSSQEESRIELEERETVESATENTEQVREGDFFPNDNVPTEYRWDEYDECTQGITNPDLARKMYELRYKRKEQTDSSEPKMIFLQIQMSKLVEKQKMERKEWEKSINTLERRSENLYTALKLAVNDKDVAVSSNKEFQAELEVKEKELEIEQETSRKSKRIGQIWMGLYRDKEKEVTEYRERNKHLERELSELKMELQVVREERRAHASNLNTN